MADIYKLRKMIDDFVFQSKPSCANYSEPCTIHDINKLIQNVANVLNAFVDELESNS